MSLKVIRNDLLKIKCDAIVDPTDIFLSGSGSIDKMIHDICGPALALELKKYKPKTTECIITSPYGLHNCKYIIHTIGPKYIDGSNGEFELLKKCYQNILRLAKQYDISNIAIPLISSGTFSFPKKEAYQIAIEEINEFLAENELGVILVVYDDESFSISKELSKEVRSYIDKNYIKKTKIRLNKIPKEKSSISMSGLEINEEIMMAEPLADIACEDKLIFELDESFSEAVLRIIRERDLNEPDVYKKAGLDRKLFSTLRSKKNYVPSKKTAIALCIALELDLKESNDLLKKAGLTLSHSNLFDVIVEYFIKNHKYDLYDINVVLLENDQELIGC